MKQTGRLTEARPQAHPCATSAERCDRRPVPARSGHGRRIVISQGQNWVWLIGPRGKVVAQGGMVDLPSELRKGSHRTGSYCGRAARIKRNSNYGGNLWLHELRPVRAVRDRLPPDPALQVERHARSTPTGTSARTSPSPTAASG